MIAINVFKAIDHQLLRQQFGFGLTSLFALLDSKFFHSVILSAYLGRNRPENIC